MTDIIKSAPLGVGMLHAEDEGSDGQAPVLFAAAADSLTLRVGPILGRQFLFAQDDDGNICPVIVLHPDSTGGGGGGGGTPGSKWFTGSGNPSNALGADTDMYLQDTGAVWQKASGAWTVTGTSIKGTKGDDGLPGTTAAIVSFFGSSKPGASAVMGRFVATEAVTFPASLTGSQGYADTAPTASAAFTVRKNGTNVGTITFAAATKTATFTAASAITLAAGDRLDVIAPASADATMADVSITLKGTR